MLTMSKFKGGSNNEKTPEELKSSLSAGSELQKGKSLTGSAVYEIRGDGLGGVHKVNIRTLQTED